MPYCIAFGCKNRSEDYHRGISFFRLPLKNQQLLKQWLIKLQLKDPPLKETSRICSEHFTDDCFERDLKAELMPGSKSKCSLKVNAVPTVFTYRKQAEPRPTSVQRLKTKEDKEVCKLKQQEHVHKYYAHNIISIYV